VDNLVLPLSTSDIAGYFSKAGTVDKVVIPDVEGKLALVVFVHPKDVQVVLKYSGKNFRNTIIDVNLPSEHQYKQLVQSEDMGATGGSVSEQLRGVFSQMDQSTILSLLQELTLMAQSKSSPAESVSSNKPINSGGVSFPSKKRYIGNGEMK
jgi:hypothetical protein